MPAAVRGTTAGKMPGQNGLADRSPPLAVGYSRANPGIKNILGGGTTEGDHFTDIAAAFQC